MREQRELSEAFVRRTEVLITCFPQGPTSQHYHFGDFEHYLLKDIHACYVILPWVPRIRILLIYKRLLFQTKRLIKS